MSWQQDHQAAALNEGWGIFPVIDNGKSDVRSRVVAVHSFPHAPAAAKHVHELALRRSPLHIHALKVVMQNLPC